MSIWCSWPGIGRSTPEATRGRGDVLSYAEGFSNHFPRTDGAVELPAAVDVADIAPWCVPGHDECGSCDGGHVGPWLRLSISAEVSRSYWEKPPARRSFHESVVMDRDAVEALAADLTRWLALDHVAAS